MIHHHNKFGSKKKLLSSSGDTEQTQSETRTELQTDRWTERRRQTDKVIQIYSPVFIEGGGGWAGGIKILRWDDSYTLAYIFQLSALQDRLRLKHRIQWKAWVKLLLSSLGVWQDFQIQLLTYHKATQISCKQLTKCLMTKECLPGFIYDPDLGSLRYDQPQVSSDTTVGRATVRPHMYPWAHHRELDLSHDMSHDIS